VKPTPVSVAALVVTGAVPVDVKVTDCVAVVFTSTLSNDTLVALMLSVGPVGFDSALFATVPLITASQPDRVRGMQQNNRMRRPVRQRLSRQI
jgi:hypothetical protein